MKCVEKGMLCAVAYYNIRRLVCKTVIPFQLAAYSLPQLQRTGGGSVARFSLLHGLYCGGNYMRRSIKVRLSGSQSYNIDSGSAHFFCLGIDCQSDAGLNSG